MHHLGTFHKGRNLVRVLEDNSQLMPREGPDIIQRCPSIIYAGAGCGTINEVEDEKGCKINILEMMGQNSCAEGAKTFCMNDSDYSAEGAKNFGPPS